MARPPAVFVRPLLMVEGQRLQRINRTAKDRVRLRRATIVLASTQGFNDVELVFLPTNASWLNWIECEFTVLRYFALNGTDHRIHTEQNAAIASYVRWRNTRA